MPSEELSTSKICVVCSEDCSSRPRVKDKKGQYYCRQCYQDAVQRKRVQAAPVKPPPPPPPPQSEDDDDQFDLLADLAEHAASAPSVEQEGSECPSCRKPMAAQAIVCTECGFNRKLGRQMSPAAVAKAPAAKSAPRAKGGGIGLPAALTQPWVLFVGPVLLLGILAAVGRGNEGAMLGFVLLARGFGFVVTVWVLVRAYRESIVTGLLALFVPLYALYFVFAKDDSPYLKAAYGSAVVLTAMSLFIAPA